MKFYRVAGRRPARLGARGRRGRLRLLDGDPFTGTRDRAETIALDRRAAAGAGHALQDRGHRPQLPRPRRGARQGHPRGAPHLPEAAHRRSSGPAPPSSSRPGRAASTTRRSWASSSARTAHDLGLAGGGARLHPGRGVRQRRDRPGAPGQGRAVHAGQGLRHLLPGGALPGHRPRPGAACEVTGRVNGAVRQQSTTEKLIFPPAQLVWFVSRVMTLLPGDIISTGTPAGIGPLRPATWWRSRWRGWESCATPWANGGRNDEDLSGHGQPEGDPRGRGAGRGGRHHHQPEPAGQGERRPRGDPARDLQDRSTAPSPRRWWPPTPRAWCARAATGPACTRTSWSSALHLGGPQGHQGAHRRRAPRQHDAHLLAHPGAARGQGRGPLRVALRGPPRRHRHPGHGAGGRHRPDLRQLRLRLRGAGRQPAPSHARGGGGQDGRPHRHHALRASSSRCSSTP